MKSTVVVLVDMQNFFLQRIPKSAHKELIENQISILKLCAEKKIPVIVLEYKNRGKTIPALQPALKKVVTEIISKPHNSGFRDTNLEEILKELKAKSVILMGINGSGCVQDTAIGAIYRGYKVLTARGVVASSSIKDSRLATTKKWFSENGTFLESTQQLSSELQN
jgi:nicotinamidase-related amidase